MPHLRLKKSKNTSKRIGFFSEKKAESHSSEKILRGPLGLKLFSAPNLQKVKLFQLFYHQKRQRTKARTLLCNKNFPQRTVKKKQKWDPLGFKTLFPIQKCKKKANGGQCCISKLG